MPDHLRPSRTEFGFYSKYNGKTCGILRSDVCHYLTVKIFSASHMNVDG